MSVMTPVHVALSFIDRINARDIDGILALMTDDHRFIDSLGVEVVGREEMRKGWEDYFHLVPDYRIEVQETFADRRTWSHSLGTMLDYRIEVQETFADGRVVILVGVAHGTYAPDGVLRAENAWETPAVWRALVRGDRVAEWRVYADNEPIRRRMSATSA